MKYIAIYLVCFLIFIGWLLYEQRKSRKVAEQESKDFWAREQEANQTRKKDISNLPLLHVSEEEIPVADTDNNSVLYYVGQVKEIIKNPMMDFSDYTNTDLKLAYGVGNFKTISEYDETFHEFLIALGSLARSYEKADLLDYAIRTYLLAIRYGTRQVADYEALARIYLRKDQPEKIQELLDMIKSSDFPHKDNLETALRNVIFSYR